jgi:hypothetical protein
VITSRCMRPCTFFFVRRAQDTKCRNVDSSTKSQFFLLNRLDISLSSPAEERASAAAVSAGSKAVEIHLPTAIDPIHNNILCAVNGARGGHINKAAQQQYIPIMWNNNEATDPNRKRTFFITDVICTRQKIIQPCLQDGCLDYFE